MMSVETLIKSCHSYKLTLFTVGTVKHSHSKKSQTTHPGQLLSIQVTRIQAFWASSRLLSNARQRNAILFTRAIFIELNETLKRPRIFNTWTGQKVVDKLTDKQTNKLTNNQNTVPLLRMHARGIKQTQTITSPLCASAHRWQIDKLTDKPNTLPHGTWSIKYRSMYGKGRECLGSEKPLWTTWDRS